MRKQRRALPHCGAPSAPRASVRGATSVEDAPAGPIADNASPDLRNDRESNASPATGALSSVVAVRAAHVWRIASRPRLHRTRNPVPRVMLNHVRPNKGSTNNQGSPVDTRDAAAFVVAAAAVAVREARAGRLPRRHPPRVK